MDRFHFFLRFLLLPAMVMAAGTSHLCRAQVRFDDTTNVAWGKDFRLVGISSPVDGQIQRAYFYRSTSAVPAPLIVSLHTWSGDYTQPDPLSALSRSANLNYIHPDFRGPDNTLDACCSDLAISDIDASITFAIENGNVDTSRIYVMGVSGGGYATLAAFMRSKHRIRKFSAWVPISDLVAWYRESSIRRNKYAGDILHCTGSAADVLDIAVARKRSPLYWDTPVGKLEDAEISVYTGIYDGIQGSVPITQTINFYNKVLSDLGVKDSAKYVSVYEKAALLELRRPLGDFGQIAGRKVCLQKQYQHIKLVVFEGNHEMLPEYALHELIPAIPVQ